MTLTDKQTGVLKGMGAAAFVAVAGLAIAVFVPVPEALRGLDAAARVVFALKCDAMVFAALGVSIGLLARHRFFTPLDIDGSALSSGSDKAHLLQAILQNTLEQGVLAVGAHLAWAAGMPAGAIAAVPAAVGMFLVGRITFAAGYRHGAPARAFGFALTFYPTMIMLVSAVAYFAVTTIS
jgi:MAPEG family